jgi:5-methylcytosine-specific restriction enzyme subunit McrC
MLAFCWRDVSLIEAGALGACDFERPLDVAARLLDVALSRLFRRGVELRYAELAESGPRLRGSIDLPRTVRGLLRARGQVAFRVDELSEDTPANRLLKATVRSLLKSPEVGLDVRQQLRRHIARFAEVADVVPTVAMNTRVVVPRNEHVYGEALWLARLTMSRWLPDEGISGVGRTRVLRTQDRTGKLFEGFIRGVARHFLRHDARVDAPLLEFDVRSASQRAGMLVPQMRTDAVISWPNGRRNLIECKFYDTPLGMPDRGEQAKFRSVHLYQALSYLNAMNVTESIPSGTIVYASPGGALDESMVLQGFPLRVVWVDLAADWPVLRDQVIDVVSWRGAVGMQTSGSASETAVMLNQ